MITEFLQYFTLPRWKERQVSRNDVKTIHKYSNTGILPIHRKRSMYLTFLNTARGSFNTWMLSFIILSYHSFSEAYCDSPSDSADFGVARSISLCQSALSVPRKACKAKQKCPPTVCPSSRELRLWNYLKKNSIVPPLNIG
jgi:hypothetical protein